MDITHVRRNLTGGIEAWSHILTFCDFFDVATLSVVCKELRWLIVQKRALGSRRRNTIDIIDRLFINVMNFIALREQYIRRSFLVGYLLCNSNIITSSNTHCLHTIMHDLLRSKDTITRTFHLEFEVWIKHTRKYKRSKFTLSRTRLETKQLGTMHLEISLIHRQYENTDTLDTYQNTDSYFSSRLYPISAISGDDSIIDRFIGYESTKQSQIFIQQYMRI